MITANEIPNWCAALDEASDGFTKPVVLKNQLPTSLMAHLAHDVLQTLSSLDADSNQHLRLYLEKNLQADGHAVLNKRKPQSNETVKNWAERSFPEEFGIILNSIQNYSDGLASFSHDFFEVFNRQFRYPLGGTDISFFIGDYQYTPLGFHKDPDGHKVVHLHLGPGTKEMYLIPAEVYENDIQHITRNKNGQFDSFMDHKQLLPYATKYVIEPGDIFYMPPSIWHVGVNLGLSAAVTLWHLDITSRDLQKKILLSLKEKLPANLNKPAVLVAEQQGETFEQLSGFLGLGQMSNGESFLQSVENSLKDYAAKLKSNGGYIQQSNIRQKAPKNWTEQDLVKLKHPFRLEVDQKNGNKMALFLRGHKITCPSHKDMPTIASQLNERRSFDFGNFCQLLESDWSTNASRQFVSLLDGYDALESRP